jgi:DNA uptake protein ComE-like DNA-binding protein
VKTTLDRSYGWKGQFYPAGEADIPDDLAEALGLTIQPIAPVEIPTTEEATPSIEVQEEIEPPQAIAINTATAEAIADGLSGVGLKVARQLVMLRNTRPDQRFTSIDDLKTISRVDWDALAPQISFD